MNKLTELLRSRAKSTFILGAALIAVIVLSIACQKPTTIKIGVVGTMTGSNSDLSVSGRRGVEIAVDEINNRGGIKGRAIELVIKDDQNDPEIAQRVDQEFVTENVRLVIGHYTSGMAIASMSKINNQELLMLAPTISADSLSRKDDNFIRFIASTKEQAIVLMDVAQKLKQSQIIIIYDERNKGFTDPLVQNYQELLKERLGAEAMVYAFNPQKPETLNQVLQAVESKEPQGLFVIAGAEDCAKVAQRIKLTMPWLQIYGPLWANTSELIRKGGTAVEGMIVVGGIDLENQSEKFRAFCQNFKERYGEDPTFSSMYSYETMMALAKAIEGSNSLKPADVKKKLIELSSFEGVQEQYSIDSFGDSTRKYQVFIINQGKLRKVE